MTDVSSADLDRVCDEGERAPTADQLCGKACFVCGVSEAPENKRILVHHSRTREAWACEEEAGESAKLTGVPWWQSEPCPPWCGGLHSANDHPLDRVHISEWSSEIPLSLAELDVLRGASDILYSVRFVSTYVQQRIRDARPTVLLSVDGKGELEVTLTEANAIAEALLSAVRRAEGRDLRAVAA
ncbi:DUF6907 domain-containing protein [Actinokineospora sp.]|uniref:DUF6907 domain-containing protein n=1 Tax=Actinokineospora sp. TaxID=1872133 RepID=UPI003D6C6C02